MEKQNTAREVMVLVSPASPQPQGAQQIRPLKGLEDTQQMTIQNASFVHLPKHKDKYISM